MRSQGAHTAGAFWLVRATKSNILKAYCEKKSAAVKIEDFKSSQAAHTARAAKIVVF